MTVIEVYVDDFIGATNDTSLTNLRQMLRAMLHGIHSIFPPPQVTKHCGADPISETKLEKGEGTWDTTEEILGWVFDGTNYTIQLPVEKCISICSDIRKLVKKTKAPLNTFQKIAGRLQHASMQRYLRPEAQLHSRAVTEHAFGGSEHRNADS